MMVHTMAETQDLKNTVSNILDVQTNPKKAFMLWFSSEVLAILDPRWNAFKHETIQLLEQYELYQPPTQMPPPTNVPG